MSNTARILAFAGSTRRDSSNKKLARAAAHAAVAAHSSVTWIDLRDYPLPLFDADIEAQGLPDTLLRLRALVADHDALILASPEYNGFFPPVLKNALDWLSRPALGQERHAVFKGLPVLLLSAVGGSNGGLAGLQQLRQQLVYLKARPHDRQFLLPQAAGAFDAHGRLSEAARSAELADTVAHFAGSLQLRAPGAAYA
ncbi:NADPH-dependent FMN reductase [Massilia sp. SM-13]|uniref:NADPH-dependent FMN reductase n=1 Tax=Pseudoduganella rhizocola TaxID=3382643 RepID=UPI0038B6B1F4